MSRACASAKGNWIPWLLPIARPKTTRRFAYSTDRSMNQRASPMHSEAIRIRSGLRTWRRGSKPWPSAPIRLPAGTSTSFRNNSYVWLLNIVRIRVRSIPFASRMSTRNRLSPSVPFREGEALHPQLAPGQVGKDLAPDRLGGEPRHEERKVELPVERLGVAPARVNLLQEEGCIGQRAASAAIFRRNEETSKALG